MKQRRDDYEEEPQMTWRSLFSKAGFEERELAGIVERQALDNAIDRLFEQSRLTLSKGVPGLGTATCPSLERFLKKSGSPPSSLIATSAEQSSF